jgi:hypothetical protein
VASRVIQVPINEMLCPPKNRRKFRWRSDRQACEIPVSFAGGEDVEVAPALTAFYFARISAGFSLDWQCTIIHRVGFSNFRDFRRKSLPPPNHTRPQKR